MREIRPRPTTHHGVRTPFIHKNLQQTTHVFVRDDTVWRPLQPAYQGPYEILARINEKLYTILIKDRPIYQRKGYNQHTSHQLKQKKVLHSNKKRKHQVNIKKTLTKNKKKCNSNKNTKLRREFCGNAVEFPRIIQGTAISRLRGELTN